MQPVLNQGEYVFLTLEDSSLPAGIEPACSFQEKEGLSIILSREQAAHNHLPSVSVYAWITLNIHSSLEAVGLTAAVSTALAHAGISCNMVAAFYHDHLFVPIEDSQKAMTILRALSKDCSNDKTPSNIL